MKPNVKSRAERIADKAADRRIDRAFNATCRNIQINILDIPKVFKHGRELIDAGADDQALAKGVRAFVDQLTVQNVVDVRNLAELSHGASHGV